VVSSEVIVYLRVWMTSTQRSLVTTVRIKDFCGNAYHRAPVSSKDSLKEKVFAVTPYLTAKSLFVIGSPFDAVLIPNEKKKKHRVKLF
jgi:hypothetical protein